MAEDVEARFRKLLEQKTELIRRLEVEKRELVVALESERGRRELAERYHDEAEEELERVLHDERVPQAVAS